MIKSHKQSAQKMKYIWQHPKWPKFTYNTESIQNILYLFAKEAAHISGSVQEISEDSQQETLLDIVVEEALKTSEIEGEFYTNEDIRSSLRNHLGLSKHKEKIKNIAANGVSLLMVKNRETYAQPLSEEMLFDWHKTLLMYAPEFHKITKGQWRKSVEPMQIVSGPYGHEKVHYEAPPSETVAYEMENFICWFNQTSPSQGKIIIPGPIRAAIAHLYFEIIHPFDDGNGRIGRAIAEKALSQDMGYPILLSLSQEILKNKSKYYLQLEYASKGELDISKWIEYFVNLVYQSQLSAQSIIQFVLYKTKFWRQFEDDLNERQTKVLHRMFQEGPSGFKGGINARKYMIIANTSKATATRDLSDLLKKGCLKKLAESGRSTRYDITYFVKN